MHPKYTIERNKTYRLRIVNTGSFASIRFSVDNHSLTLIEADGTLLAPTEVAGVTVAVAQRYSVLLYANQTSSTNGTYWMRATLQSDMFTYDQPGQNLDIRGVIRYGVFFPTQRQLFFLPYAFAHVATPMARKAGSLAIPPRPTPARASPALATRTARPCSRR
jgi:hypothetical protein